MPVESMTPKERWQAVLERKTPDRVPMDIWATQEVWDRLHAYFGADQRTIMEKLHIDAPVTVMPEYKGSLPNGGDDPWGSIRRRVDYGTGAYDEVANAPLAQYTSVDEIEANYVWPSADDWDFSGIAAQFEGNEHRPIRGGGSEPFLTYKYLRGEEQGFMDLLMNPEIAHYCLDKLFDFCYEGTRRIFEAIPGKVMITYVAEDLGGQSSLMFSPEQIREYFLPRMKRMMDLTRENGSHVFTHTDGAVRDIIPDLIATGTQVLNPIQWVCPGMEREALKQDFGDRLIFHGGVDNQRIMPFGTPEEVREEVLTNFATLGKGGGYILCPCHNLQPVTPVENILALYETGYEYGWR